LKKIYFRGRGGGKQGWGNIYRLIAIHELVKKKYECFFIFEGNNQVANFIKEKKVKYLRLKENITISEEERIIEKLEKADLSIIEMLECSYARQKIYKKRSNKIIVFDDILKKKYCADKVISAQYKSRHKNVKNLLFGYEYYPLRKEFSKYLKKKKIVRKEIKKILVCLGGSSYSLGNKKMFNFLKNENYHTTIILGNEQKKLFIKKNTKAKNLLFKEKTNNLAKLIHESDLVIAGGGYVKIETAFLKTPMLVMPVQRHQLELVKDFKKYCSVPFTNYPTKLNNKIIKKNLEKYNHKFRTQMNKTLKSKFKINIFKDKILSLINV